MAQDGHEGGGNWNPQRPASKIDEELEFFTELALHETERWLEVGTVLIMNQSNLIMIK